ncbi:hypothetical protein NDU88_003955 [Pleurodeles waltl]|uniref:Uncharacterized protein n=1 Tax=Pleurodeles waltl TaxID=8319 RepID=A0AAV7VFQ3_PLEWA|nr:hypothetical protein NDU88_003955 [Pleurodeles waltl]
MMRADTSPGEPLVPLMAAARAGNRQTTGHVLQAHVVRPTKYSQGRPPASSTQRAASAPHLGHRSVARHTSRGPALTAPQARRRDPLVVE